MHLITSAWLFCRRADIEGGQAAIFCALAINNTLTFLDLGLHNDERDRHTYNLFKNQFVQDDIQGLAFGLTHNSRLETLGLCSAFDKAADMTPFTKALALHRHLVHLDLSYNTISNKSAKALGEALATNCSLKYLNIAYVETTEEAYWSVCRGLAANTCLVALRLGWHDAKKNNEEAVSYLVTHNVTLRSLVLWDHEAGGRDIDYNYPPGYTKLVKAVMCNTTLQSLALGDIGTATAFSIAKLLQKNTTLRELEASCFVAYHHHISVHGPCEDLSALFLAALKDHPRYFLPGIEFPNCEERTVLESLGLGDILSPEQDAWAAQKCIRMWHLEKVAAFAMAQHARLGQTSAAQQLGQDCANMVMMSYFGLPFDYDGTTAEYAHVLQAVPYEFRRSDN